MRCFFFFSLAVFASSLIAQDTVNVTVDAAKTVGPNKPFWTYFGYDEPNYTTAKNGRNSSMSFPISASTQYRYAFTIC